MRHDMDHWLSPRQVEVFALLREGLTNRQIAHRLGLSEATVKTHVSATLQRLGMSSRVQAAVLAEDDERISIGALRSPPLTDRQARILDLVTEGLTNRQIGRGSSSRRRSRRT